MAEPTYCTKQLETWITGEEIAYGSSDGSTDECVITALMPLTLLHHKQTRVWVSERQKEIGLPHYHLGYSCAATSSSWAEWQSLLLAHKLMNWNFIPAFHSNLKIHSWFSIKETAVKSDLTIWMRSKFSQFPTSKLKRKKYLKNFLEIYNTSQHTFLPLK